MRQLVADWSYRCLRCGTWGSTLRVRINSHADELLDEGLREAGLSTLREQNNATVLDRLSSLGAGPGSRVLDIGAAHGWFVRAARDRGMSAHGIEPDEAMAEHARVGGADVRSGFFPDALASSEKFDAICFNDVLEHLPDAGAAVDAAGRHLQPGGLLSINIPNSGGLAYRGALVGHRLGLRALFERLWQVGLPSPHVWYFDEPGLRRLCEERGLATVSAGRLPSVSRAGLWQRAHIDREASVLTAAGVAAAWVAAPLLNSNRCSDIMHLVFRRTS